MKEFGCDKPSLRKGVFWAHLKEACGLWVKTNTSPPKTKQTSCFSKILSKVSWVQSTFKADPQA